MDFFRKFLKITSEFRFNNFYFGNKQKYLWQQFYNMKKPLTNKAIPNKTCKKQPGLVAGRERRGEKSKTCTGAWQPKS